MLKSAEWQLNKMLEKCTDPCEKEMQEMMNKDVMELLKVFEEQGHSGFSAFIAVNLFSKLAKYKLITEIEDNPDDRFTRHKPLALATGTVGIACGVHVSPVYSFKDKQAMDNEARTPSFSYGEVQYVKK